MSRHLAAPLVFHSSRVSVIVVAVVGVVVGPVSYFGFFFFHPRVSDSVAWYGRRDEHRASSDNEQAKRNGRLLLGPTIKVRASFGVRLHTPGLLFLR